RLLGGEIRLSSVPRSGSTFTLFLPMTYTPPRALRKGAGERAHVDAPRPGPNGNTAPVARIVEVPPMPIGDVHSRHPAIAPPPPIVDLEEEEEDDDTGDDRHAITAGDRVLLIVENEPGFARLLLEAARAKGFKGIVTSSGVSALALAAEYAPAAVTLDIFLPDIDGWRVLD